VRASALAYATLLALIPMLAIVVSITSSFLKKEGEERINQLIVKVVDSVTPPATLTTNTLAAITNSLAELGAARSAANLASSNAATIHQGDGTANANNDQAAVRKAVAREIHELIQNTRSGALGVTGSVLLIFVAISMLTRIEATFNDIWGVSRGRNWFMQIVLYWGVLSLAPLLLVVVLGLATGRHMESTKHMVENMPLIGNFLFRLGFSVLPVAIVCLTFSAFYMLMPNTRVDWRAALVGGVVGGLLFHLNNLVSVFYVSRVVSNSKLYGSLGLVPVFMIGLYFAWLILLFGAQVAYAYQNRNSYLEEKQVENVNQRGREFIALRLMTCIGERFGRGEPPVSGSEMSTQLSVPSRLVTQVMQTLSAARLVVETAGQEAFVPARPLEQITCHDILLAMRASQGQELATSDEPARVEVYGEFQRIQEAERQAASSVTLMALVNRAQRQLTT
jgi:membrane protein